MNNAVYNDPASIQAAEGIFSNEAARQNTVAPVNQLVPQPAVNLGVTPPVDANMANKFAVDQATMASAALGFDPNQR